MIREHEHPADHIFRKLLYRHHVQDVYCLQPGFEKSGLAMTTVCLTSQPLSGVLRAKAVYRTIGIIIGGAAMVAIVPNSDIRRH
jgi:hypothetical protein